MNGVKLRVTKMHGLGNNYIYVNEFEETLAESSLPALAIRLSDVHTGIGSDGMILIGPSDVADFRMRIFNADGSEGRNCGNGLRCVAKYVADRKMTDKTSFTIETLGGLMEVLVHAETAAANGGNSRIDGVAVNVDAPQVNGITVSMDAPQVNDIAVNMNASQVNDIAVSMDAPRVNMVTVNMGVPRLNRRDIPMTGEPDSTAIDEELVMNGNSYRMTAVSMGNPHAVIFVPNVALIPLADIGPQIECAPLFPERVNVEFVSVRNERELDFRVWERGSGITQACGTGACAAVAAGVVNGHLKQDALVTVHLPGGDLEIVWSSTDSCIYMKGPAAFVLEGDFLLDELLQ